MALFWKIVPPLLPSFGGSRKMGGGEDVYYYFTNSGFQRCQTYGLLLKKHFIRLIINFIINLLLDANL